MLSHLHMSCVILFHFPWNILILLEYLLRKMSDFVSIPLFGFTLVIKLRNFDFESHWNISVTFDKQRYGVRFEYIPWENVWFYLIPIIWVHFSHWNVLIFSDKERYGVRFENVPWKNVWFCVILIVWFLFSHKTEKIRF